MDQKLKTFLALAVALFVLVLVLVLVFSGSNFGSTRNTTGVEYVDVFKNNVKYRVNINTKTLARLSESAVGQWGTFAGLPLGPMTDSKMKTISKAIQDKENKFAIVSVITVNPKEEPSAFDDSRTVLAEEEFLCQLDSKNCTPSQLLTAVKDLGKSVAPYLVWTAWQSGTDPQFFGHVSGEGIGNRAPVVIVQPSSGSARYTSQYKWNEATAAGTFVGAEYLSPSRQKIALVDNFAKKLVVYDTNDLNTPAQSLNISSVIDADTSGGIRDTVWHPRESKIAIATDHLVYLADLNTGGITLLFEDQTRGEGGLAFLGMAFSSGGRFLVLTDYIGLSIDYRFSGPGQQGNLATDQTTKVLRVIDLAASNQQSELARGDVGVYRFSE